MPACETAIATTSKHLEAAAASEMARSQAERDLNPRRLDVQAASR
jgi:hypothetical protein